VRDRNLRIHLAAGVLAGAFVAVAPLAAAERAVILVCVAAVIAAEVANTAIEALVDLVSPRWDERARIAKDAAAAAVLVVAAGSVLAFATIAAGRWGDLVAVAPALRGVALEAAVVAGSAAWLPWRAGGRTRILDAIVAAAAGLALVRFSFLASAQAGTVAMALCLAIAISGAWRKRRLEPG